ncbi:hypothetical protein L209DRAFT_744873 [Thermothelomyces heterothallicus CBS 203.75]
MALWLSSQSCFNLVLSLFKDRQHGNGTNPIVQVGNQLLLIEGPELAMSIERIYRRHRALAEYDDIDDDDNDNDNNKNDMSGQAASNEGELSFGLEFEFLFYFKTPWADAVQGPDAIVVDEEEEARLPPALSLPDNVRWSYSDFYPLPGAGHDDTPRGWATSLIRQAILSVPGARIQGEPMPDGTDPSYLDMYVVGDDHHREYSGWVIGDDPSVSDHGIQIRGYDYMNFELSTPALWDRPESHRHVYLVVQELVKRFRLRVNVSSGLHCHVGAGLRKPPGVDGGGGASEGSDGDDSDDNERGDHIVDEPGFESVEEAIPFRGTKHDLGVFKRAAALLWAADGFLCHAHPPERGLSRYAPPLRLCSRLAHGLRLDPFEDANGYVQHYERRLDDDGDGDVPEEKLTMELFNMLEAEARFRTLTLGFSSEINPAPERLRVLRVYSGVSHILRCRNHAEVAGLLTPPDRTPFGSRLNYNFSQYLGTFPAVTGRTVEFRESAGSLSPAWVAAWSAVCLGVFRFARDAPADRFWAVLGRLAAAEAAAARSPKGKVSEEGKGGHHHHHHRYDAVSLLLDIGLFAEAALLETTRLRPRDAGGHPVRAWYPCRLADPPPATPVWLPPPTSENACPDW